MPLACGAFLIELRFAQMTVRYGSACHFLKLVDVDSPEGQRRIKRRQTLDWIKTLKTRKETPTRS